MRAIVILIATIFFTYISGGEKVNGQTVAVGRVFAEVVESVSVSSQTISNFELSKSTESLSASLPADTLNLGAITIHTGRNITCNIVLTPASLKDEEGNRLTIDTAVKNEMLAAPVSANGIQTVQLGATPAISQDQASGNYKGSYTIIFAYN